MAGSSAVAFDLCDGLTYKEPLFVFQANRNCLVIASTHDIQELDVSSILATQVLTWIDDEAETEVKG